MRTKPYTPTAGRRYLPAPPVTPPASPADKAADKAAAEQLASAAQARIEKLRGEESILARQHNPDSMGRSGFARLQAQKDAILKARAERKAQQDAEYEAQLDTQVRAYSAAVRKAIDEADTAQEVERILSASQLPADADPDRAAPEQ